MRFTVKTWETVEGTYDVEAESAEAAQAMFGDPKIEWSEHVSQRDYMAFSLEVRSVELTP